MKTELSQMSMDGVSLRVTKLAQAHYHSVATWPWVHMGGETEKGFEIQVKVSKYLNKLIYSLVLLEITFFKQTWGKKYVALVSAL